MGWVAVAWLACGAAWAAAWPPPLAKPTSRTRLLVLAPHPDDEVLGAGGLIQQTLAAGGAVRVVVLTNGDAFKAVARDASGHKNPTAADFISLGNTRKQETRAALARLGLPATQVSFLGYPDAGLLNLWTESWDTRRPYTSPATRTDHVPYPDAFHPRAPYAGRAVLDDLDAIIRRFRPTVMVLPDPGDRHPDHWVAYAFGTAARYEVAPRAQTLCYLIHKTGWSEPAGRGKTSRPPDRAQNWHALALTAAQAATKARAVECYQSQLPRLGAVMRQFAGGPELYVARPWETLPRLAATGDKGRDYVRLRELTPAFTAPEEEGVAPARITWVTAAGQGRSLRLLVKLAEPLGPGEACWLYLHPLARGRVAPPQGYELSGKMIGGGVTVKRAGRFVEVAMPWKGNAGAILGLEVISPKHPAGRTPWVVLVGR